MRAEDVKRLRPIVDETGHMTRVEGLLLLDTLEAAWKQRDEARAALAECRAVLREVLDSFVAKDASVKVSHLICGLGRGDLWERAEAAAARAALSRAATPEAQTCGEWTHEMRPATADDLARAATPAVRETGEDLTPADWDDLEAGVREGKTAERNAVLEETVKAVALCAQEAGGLAIESDVLKRVVAAIRALKEEP